MKKMPSRSIGGYVLLGPFSRTNQLDSPYFGRFQGEPLHRFATGQSS